jgi:hypothetical protein
MNVEIGTEAAQFPEKVYIIGIFVAVQSKNRKSENFVKINTQIANPQICKEKSSVSDPVRIGYPLILFYQRMYRQTS